MCIIKHHSLIGKLSCAYVLRNVWHLKFTVLRSRNEGNVTALITKALETTKNMIGQKTNVLKIKAYIKKVKLKRIQVETY